MSARLLRRHGGLLALEVYEAAAYSRTCARRYFHDLVACVDQLIYR